MMDEITYEITCDDCGSEYELIQTVDLDTEGETPIYCPFCGALHEEDDLDQDDEEYELNLLDELDFDVD